MRTSLKSIIAGVVLAGSIAGGLASATPASAQSIIGGGGSSFQVIENPAPRTQVSANCYTMNNRIETEARVVPEAGWDAQWVYVRLTLTRQQTGERFTVDSGWFGTWSAQTGVYKNAFNVSRGAPGSYAVSATIWKYNHYNGTVYQSGSDMVPVEHTMVYNYNVYPFSSKLSNCILGG